MSNRGFRTSRVLFWIGIGLIIGILLDRATFSLVGPPGAATKDASDLALVNQAWSIIDQFYVGRAAVQSKQMAYGAINGMVQALGDTGHTTFLSPEMDKRVADFTSDRLDGIGAEAMVRDKQIVILSTMDNSPAQKAGLRPGEILVKVNDQPVSAPDIAQVMANVAGPAGTSVKLTVQDPVLGQTREITLTRAHLNLTDVAWQQVPGTDAAHLRIASFGAGVSLDVTQAVAEIESRGLKKVILDLRDNPGGLLDEGVGVSSQFLIQGTVVIEKDQYGRETPQSVQPGGIGTDIQLVVLVDGGTASTAEIVAAALQDNGRAKLVGEQTFGAGTVLSHFPLSDGSGLLLATGEWLTPNHQSIWHRGISPDVRASLAAGAIPLLPEEEAGMSAPDVQASGDSQLLQALEMLQTGVGH